MIFPSADVSVIIPCFNSASTISRAVNSVLGQTLSPNEIIIVDDASTDNSINIISGLVANNPDRKILYIQLGVNSGVSRARNLGWEMSSSKYIAFLDSDDSWHPEKIRIQYDFMERMKIFDMSGHYSQIYDGFCEKIDANGDVAYKVLFFDHFLLRNRFSTPTVMIKRDIPLRFNESKKYSEDYALWLEMSSKNYIIALMPINLCFLHKNRYGESGLSSNLFEMWFSELSTFYSLHQDGKLSFFYFIFFGFFSFFKYIKRVVFTHAKLNLS